MAKPKSILKVLIFIFLDVNHVKSFILHVKSKIYNFILIVQLKSDSPNCFSKLISFELPLEFHTCNHDAQRL